MREEYEQGEQEFADTQQAESAAEEATRKAEEARTRDLQCNAARERFNVYTTAPRLYETLPGGERRYLTEDELTAAREQAARCFFTSILVLQKSLGSGAVVRTPPYLRAPGPFSGRPLLM